MSSTNPKQEPITNQPTLVELEDLEELSDDGLLDSNAQWDIQPLRPQQSSNTLKISYGFLVLFMIFCIGGIILLAYSTLSSESPPKTEPKTKVFAKYIQDWPPTKCRLNHCRMNLTR